jgi:hypothetical protein
MQKPAAAQFIPSYAAARGMTAAVDERYTAFLDPTGYRECRALAA